MNAIIKLPSQAIGFGFKRSNYMDNKNSKNEAKKSKIIQIISMFAAFFLVMFFIFFILRDIKRHGLFSPPIPKNFHKKIEIDEIKSWMTFDFINKTFGLPNDYLKKELNISDKKYPNMTIDNLAKNNKEASDPLLKKIKKLIQDFQNQTLPKIPPAT